MYKPTNTELTAAAITAIFLIIIFGGLAGLLIYLVGAAATYAITVRRMPDHYAASRNTAILCALSVWPITAWDELKRLRK